LFAILASLGYCLWAGGQMPMEPAKPAQGPPAAPKEFEDFDKVIADSQKLEGVFTLHQKKDRLLMEIQPGQMDKPYLFLIALARGIGTGELLGGYTLNGMGDDWLLSFKRVGNRVHVIRKNVRFRAQPGSPAANAVKLAYTDSVLAALRILTVSPRGGVVIDLTDFLLADLPDLASVLRGRLGLPARFDTLRSTLAKVKNFPLNSEIEIAAVYASEQLRELETVPDSRGVSIHIRYSLTALPETGYRPRLADDRVGYFVTALKDYSKPTDETAFVRYINRWHLEKADPKAEKSPPKQPIIFYIEKTVPYQYRKPVREGILEWNKAFEQIGFLDAIEVRIQPDDADWDPEDVRYNTFRWITASAGFAMGPSRVNPLTGQIFDADIIFDADMIRFWQMEWDRYHDVPPDALAWNEQLAACGCCDLMHGRARDLAFGASVLLVRNAAPGGKVPEELIHQAIKETVMHEVGHTLGLRHNFKASTLWKPEELHDTARTRERGISASVMDYNPVNIAPKGVAQGDYYSTTIGPYDYWAIEYGYKPLAAATPEAELPELKKIAARSTEPGHAYATDEDTRGFDPDPLANRWDMGSDPLAYARRQADLIEELWQGKLVERAATDGKGYQRVRQVFAVTLNQYQMALNLAARYVGGQEFSRNHKGDPNARPPFVVVDSAKQREALRFLKERAFSDKSFRFSPELLNSLAPDRWMHWGTSTWTAGRMDYPIHEQVLRVQASALNHLFHPITLARVLDNERKCKDENCLTLPELFREVTAAVWSELDVQADIQPATNRQPLISSYRRGLQREHLKLLIALVLSPSSGTPEDARTLAWSNLKRLDRQIEQVLQRHDAKLDDYTRAHLEESQMRIQKALQASFQRG
jgi:hypothetical protein